MGQIYFAEYGDRLHEAKELIEKAMELGSIPDVSEENAKIALLLNEDYSTRQTKLAQIIAICYAAQHSLNPEQNWRTWETRQKYELACGFARAMFQACRYNPCPIVHEIPQNQL